MSLLSVQDLHLSFGEQEVLHGLDLTVEPGEFLALVGESGSGKSMTALTVMGLLPDNARITGGSILFDGEKLLGRAPKELDQLRGRQMSMVFQDALTSLNPVLTIGDQLTEGMRHHLGMTFKEAEDYACTLLEKVGLSGDRKTLRRYPHTLSGGQRQRVSIAMALACKPKLLIADEPTTALDVTVQAQIMELLWTLQQETGMAILFITHDMMLAARHAHRLAVAWEGKVVETGSPHQLLTGPRHDYTRRLIQAAEKLRLK
ncbi:MAG: ABC transporter ATP-binding protein [Oscillospiraceae bacterium]|nr:ABC transporter ATP-binding protein [Oscillospiraceae bacterium]